MSWLKLRKMNRSQVSIMFVVPLLLFSFQNCETTDFETSLPTELTLSEVVTEELVAEDEIHIDIPQFEIHENSSANKVFRCTIMDNGKSRHLALLNLNESSETGVPESICMSKYACESIVSKKFNVQSADYAIQCTKKIASVVSLSDLEIERILAEYK